MQIKADHNLILQVMEAVMEKGMDYGLIPGCGEKPSLLKPGSEKLMMTFRLASKPITEDLSGSDEIRYRVTTEIIHAPTGMVIGYGVGEASTNEEKYKWRKAICEEEWAETPEDRRRTKWSRGYKGEKNYQTKQVRTNPSDLANTVLKMADKRSVVSGVLKATAASSIFTQDLEDLSDDVRQAVSEAEVGSMPMPKAKEPAAPTNGAPAAAAPVANGTTKLDKSKMRRMQSKMDNGTCAACKGATKKDDWIYYDGDTKKAYHEACA